MNSFLQVLSATAKDRRTHYERVAIQTRQHFARHPECRRQIISMDDEGCVTRGKGEIDVERRCQPGWFTQDMWKGNRFQPDRPVEQKEVQPEAVYLSFSLRRGQSVKEIVLRGQARGEVSESPLLTRPGQAVNANEFMRHYLKVLHRSQQPSRPALLSPARPVLMPIKAKVKRESAIKGLQA
jgi:hypothetical protein